METSSYYTISDHDYERDSPSPYPPSTPSLDSDSDEEPTTSTPHLANIALRSSIAALPEYRLQDIVLRLADKNPAFRRAIQKEVAFLRDQDLDTPPATPTTPLHSRKSKRAGTGRPSKSRATRRTTKASLASNQGTRSEDASMTVPPTVLNTTQGLDDCVYHPGHLEDEVYEFVSRTPNGAAFKVVQTVTMWSCCNEDEWSPGCILIAPTFGVAAEDKIPRPCHQGTKLASSEMDATRSTLAMVAADDDVYPDSELESPQDDHLVTSIVPKTRRVHSLA